MKMVRKQCKRWIRKSKTSIHTYAWSFNVFHSFIHSFRSKSGSLHVARIWYEKERRAKFKQTRCIYAVLYIVHISRIKMMVVRLSRARCLFQYYISTQQPPLINKRKYKRENMWIVSWRSELEIITRIILTTLRRCMN